MAFDILCDFDGTISKDDVTDLLLKRFAAPEWEVLERRWQDGEIDARECMERQVALIDCSAAELDAALDEVAIDPGFPAFVAMATRFGASVTVVSDGLDHAIRRVLARHRVGDLPVLANRLVPAGARRYRLEHPHARGGCEAKSGTCKCAAARSRRNPCILVGDGRSDFCASGAVDLVLAKDALARHCGERVLPHFVFESFTELVLMLPTVAELLGNRGAAFRLKAA